MGKKDQQILKLKNAKLAIGEPASEIVFVDGNKRSSASKL